MSFYDKLMINVCDPYLVVAKVRERLEVSKKEQTSFIWRGSISRN
jgi:hypothetical protein